MKYIIGIATVFLVFGSIQCAISSRRNDRRIGRHMQKTKMLLTNKIPKVLHLDTNEIVAEPEVNTMLDPCEDCKAVVSKIDAVVKDPAKLAELKGLLMIACDMAPSAYRDECKDVVNNIESIAEELAPLLADPQAFCTEIHLCGNDRKARVFQFFMLFVKKYINQIDAPEANNDALCDECTFAMTELKTLLQDQAIQNEIKDELKQICALLGSMKDECDSLVDQFFPTLIQELESLLSNPKEVCTELGLCGSVRMAINGFHLIPSRIGMVRPNVGLNKFRFLLSRLHTRNGMNVGCIFCKFSINQLVNAIKDDPTILDNIASGMQDLCQLFPQLVWRPGCQDFLNMYAKPVLMLTLDEINADQICDNIHLCSSHEYAAIRENQNNEDWKNEVICDACETLASFLKFECAQASFQKALANECKQLCDIIPGSLATQCDNLMDQYVPYMIQLLVTELDPHTICPELHLCNAGAVREVQNEIGV